MDQVYRVLRKYEALSDEELRRDRHFIHNLDFWDVMPFCNTRELAPRWERILQRMQKAAEVISHD